MKINFIDLQAQYAAYKDEIDEAIHGVLDSSQYILGPEVAALEGELAAFTGSGHCVCCSSGTDALLLALMGLGVGPGDEVITTPFTFMATAETVAFLGAKPVFADIEERTYNIDPALIEPLISERTRAIIPVGLYGQPADMEAINAVAARHDLPVIEDAAQSFGARYREKRSCNLSTVGCTSFFPAKPLGCYGDGGALFTADADLAERIRALLNHGQGERYRHRLIGINGRLDAIQAAVLRVKLRHFPAELEARRRVAARYDALLDGERFITPFVKEDRTSVFAQYSVRVKERESLVQRLHVRGVPTAIHYPIPLYRQEALSSFCYRPADYPVAERVCGEILSLPMSAFLREEEQEYIARAINEK